MEGFHTTFSISEVSKKVNLPASTIRFYDKEGLIPFIEKRGSGYRIFKESDIEMLKIIDCLKQTEFVEWIKIVDEIFEERRIVVEKQIEELHATLEVIEHKRVYYENALREKQ